MTVNMIDGNIVDSDGGTVLFSTVGSESVVGTSTMQYVVRLKTAQPPSLAAQPAMFHAFTTT